MILGKKKLDSVEPDFCGSRQHSWRLASSFPTKFSLWICTNTIQTNTIHTNNKTQHLWKLRKIWKVNFQFVNHCFSKFIFLFNFSEYLTLKNQWVVNWIYLNKYFFCSFHFLLSYCLVLKIMSKERFQRKRITIFIIIYRMRTLLLQIL